MQKTFVLIAVILTALSSYSQKLTGKLKFQQGQAFDIAMDVKSTISQEAMGQAIDFNVDGTAFHNYKVTNATADNNTLHHEAKRIKFSFEGMGQSRTFDSDNAKDMESPLGPPVKETLKQTFDMVVDPAGKVLMVNPEKMEAAQMDERMKFIFAMLNDVMDVVKPPQKGTASFFQVLPEKEVGQGDTWTEAQDTDAGKYSNTYTVNSITDSTIVVDLNGTSSTTSKVEIMAGMEITTTLNNKTTGQIVLDKNSGLIRRKTLTTESNGTTSGMGGETPITRKSTVTVNVKETK